MANPYAISTFLDAELGEAINDIINALDYGSATFMIKEFMEHHKDELIAFWNKQGKDGQAIFDKWFKKWSMTKKEQAIRKTQKEKDAHDKLAKQYLALGTNAEQSEEFATAFPDTNPIEVIRVRTYSLQNNGEKKLEDKAKQERLECPEYKDMLSKKKDVEEFIQKAQRNPNNPAYSKDAVDRAKARLAEIDQKIQTFLESQT